jgi:hypothetical protein
MAPIADQDCDSSNRSNTVRSRVLFWDWRAILLVVICTVLFFQSPDAPFYSFVWENEREEFTAEEGLSLVEVSENTDRLGKGRLFLVTVSEAGATQQNVSKIGNEGGKQRVSSSRELSLFA